MVDEQKHYHGHRSRVKEKFLNSISEVLSDYEILEMFLFLLIPRKDTKVLAKEIIERNGNIAKIFNLPENELIDLFGKNSAVYFKLFKEISKRMLKAKFEKNKIISSNQELIDYLTTSIGHMNQENFIILYLDKKNMLLEEEVINFGTVDKTTIYPREVIKKALSINATAIILVHNHPSNNHKPSHADITLTLEIQRIANSLNIELHDHIIVTSSNNFSFKQNGLI